MMSRKNFFTNSDRRIRKGLGASILGSGQVVGYDVVAIHEGFVWNRIGKQRIHQLICVHQPEKVLFGLVFWLLRNELIWKTNKFNLHKLSYYPK